MNLTAVDAIKEMWRMADKPERLRCLHKIVHELDTTGLTAKTFWTNFWSVWTSSESLFLDEQYFRELIAFGNTLGKPTVGLDAKERAAITKMPKLVTVYRGACPHNDIAWSWTTDLEKARWFAGRAFGDTTRLVLQVTVPKKDIVGFLMGRGESEVVIDPQSLDYDMVETIEEFEQPEGKTSSLFHAIQTGQMLDNPEMDEMRARMQISTISPDSYDDVRATLVETSEFVTWAGLSRAGYFAKCIEMIDRAKGGEELMPKEVFAL